MNPVMVFSMKVGDEEPHPVFLAPGFTVVKVVVFIDHPLRGIISIQAFNGGIHILPGDVFWPPLTGELAIRNLGDCLLESMVAEGLPRVVVPSSG